MKVSSSKNNFQFSDNEYGYLTLSANQTSGFSVGDPVKFNTKSAGNITFNQATYQVTLKKNRTYRLMSGVTTATTNAGGYLEPRFYNVTAGASLGTIGEGVTTTYTSNLAPQCMAYAVITPTVDTVIEVRIYAVSGTPTAIYYLYSFWEIQQINIVSPVIENPDLKVKAGMIMAWGGATIPSGWLNCDGSAVSRTVYNKLFSAISTIWGAGDGSTTFNLPDLRSATLRGVGTPTLYTSNTAITLAQIIDDKFQEHKHKYSGVYNYAFKAASGTAVGVITSSGQTSAGETTGAGYDTYRVGAETTGKARGVYHIIKY